jgi:hypothetical protein
VSQFTSPLIIELIGPNLWRTFYPFDYHVGSYPSKEIIVVPTGFVTDFASIPRILWPVLSPVGEYGKAALLHDYCCAIQYKKDRKYCDDIFKEAMQVLRVHPLKIFILYWGVRMFGEHSWNNAKLRGK